MKLKLWKVDNLCCIGSKLLALITVSEKSPTENFAYKFFLSYSYFYFDYPNISVHSITPIINHELKWGALSNIR